MGVLRTSILLTLLLLSGLSCFIAPAKAYIAIQVLYKGQQTDNYSEYIDSKLFSRRFVNFDSTITGYLSESTPRDACSPLSPPPSSDASTWILLVSDYPRCPWNMIEYARNASYSLIIVFNNTHRDLDSIVFSSGFPVVNIAEKYALYLQANALANSTDDPITISVEVNMLPSIFVVVLPVGFVISVCCLCSVICCCCYCRRSAYQRRAAERRHYAEIRIQRDRLARQALVQSILRQLQELQLDLSLQVPLGAAETARLNTRPFTAEESKEEQACAICVDDFSEGETVKVLPCDHIFHPQCIDEWLNRHSSLCPLCKADVRQASSGGGAAPTNSGQPQIRAHLHSGMINVDTDSTDSDSTSSRSEDALLPRTSRTLPGYGSV